MLLLDVEVDDPLHPLRVVLFCCCILQVWTMREYHSTDPIILSVGEEDEVSIADAAKMIAAAMNFEGNVVFDTDKVHGAASHSDYTYA